MQFEGILKSWNDDRGFGFIEPDQGGQDIFVHIKAFKSLRARPEAGQRLSFEIEQGPQGKKRAFNVVADALDKSAARRGGWRTAESTLHMLALIGGWPGALVAQQVLNHPKRSFASCFGSPWSSTS